MIISPRYWLILLAILLALPIGGWYKALFKPAELDVPALPYELEYTSGEASLSPDTVRANSSGNHLTLTVTLGPEPIQPGGQVVLITPAAVLDMGAGPRLYTPQLVGTAPFQNDDPTQPNYISIDPVPGQEQVKLELMTQSERRPYIVGLFRGRGQDQEPYSTKELVARLARFPIKVSGAPLPGGSKLVWHLGGLEGRSPGMRTSARECMMQIAVLIDQTGSGQLKVIKNSPTLTVTGQVAIQTRVVVPSVVRPGSPFEALVQAVDVNGARDPGFLGNVSLKVRGQPVEYTVPFTAAEHGEKRISLSGVPAGTWWIDAVGISSREPLKPSSQPFLARADGPLLWWGDTHRHSILADAFLPPVEVYRRGLEEEHLDWMCLSEHSHPDVYDRFGHYRRRLTLTPSEWMYLIGLSDKYDQLEHFTSLTGYEWTSREGHRNVYFNPAEKPEPLLSHLTPGGSLSVDEFLKAFQGRKVFIIPHHPGWALHGRRSYTWGPKDLAEPLQRLVEVYSQHGNSEFFANPRPIHAGPGIQPPPGGVVRLFMGRNVLGPQDQAADGDPGFVRAALAAGRHMGIIASSDNHFYSTGDISYHGGYTAAWAPANDRGSIWNALNDRSAFGTSGPRMLLDLHVSGLGVGQEGKVTGAPVVTGTALGTAPFTRVELVRFDKNGYRFPVVKESSGDRVDLTLTDADFAGPGFYYLRAVQTDGELGWAGPIWVE